MSSGKRRQSVDLTGALSVKITRFYAFNNGGKVLGIGDAQLVLEDDNGDSLPFLTLKGVKLFKNEKGYGWLPPSSPRMKNGEQVEQNGKPVYDNHYDLGTARTDDGDYRISSAGWAFKDLLVDALVAAHEKAGNAERGRGPAKPERSKRRDDDEDERPRGRDRGDRRHRRDDDEEDEDERPKGKRPVKFSRPPKDEDDENEWPFSNDDEDED